MKYLNRISFAVMSLALVAGISSCSKEEPFGGEDGDTAYGRFAKSALSVELKNENAADVFNRPTRAGVPDVNDFTVAFIKEGETEAAKSFVYSEMPEVVELPVGAYTVKASYGDNAPAAWEAPYYAGQGDVTIVEDEITEKVDPIVCSLSNVRVSVAFDKTLRDNMSADSKVTVRMGTSEDAASLDFTVADTERSGYFAYAEGSTTLAAVFSGQVEGYPTSETTAYDDVAPGKHYRITFKLHDAGEEDPGDITGNGLSVDATITVTDLNSDFEHDDETIEDDMRPTEDFGDPEPGPGPDPVEPTAGPSITAAGYDFDKTNDITPSSECVIKIHSDSGVTGFEVNIISDKLNPDELAGVGLASHLDLVNPGALADPLSGLGFPVGDAVTGKTDLDFGLTGFMPMLAILGDGEIHSFELIVTDASGTTKKTLTLRMNAE